MILPEKPTAIEEILANDILGPWIESGLIPQKYIITSDDRVIHNALIFPLFDAPWIYACPDRNRNCTWWKEISMMYGFVHSGCMACWKVVVVPANIRELFKLYAIQLKMIAEDPFCFCKCGVEMRDDVERNYGGYFYNPTLEAGLRRYEQVRELVNQGIGKHVPVYLKRSCTEYERKYGPTTTWPDRFGTPTHRAIEDKLNEIFCLTNHENFHQSELVKAHTIKKWITFAASRGDATLASLNDGKKLYPGYDTYEAKTQEEQKDERETTGEGTC